MIKTWISAFSFMIFMVTSVTWAAPVPDTGQTKCYNATVEIPCPSPGQPFYGQDGNYSTNPMSYTKLGASGVELPDSATEWIMVRDNVTGLIWEMKSNLDGVINYNDPHDADNTYTWYDSNAATNGGDPGIPGDGTTTFSTEDFINSLNNAHFGGYSDWRMPTIRELIYIDNESITVPGPTIETLFFPNTNNAHIYWSSNTYSSDMNDAWLTSYWMGIEHYGPKGLSFCVRAVRGGQSHPSYVNNSDGTITDTSTGLMWQQYSNNVLEWEQALANCEGLDLGGHTDWRLPSLKELLSLVDYSRYNPSINTDYFPDTVYSPYNDTASYWSSTTTADGTSRAWSIYFSYGYSYSVMSNSNSPPVKYNYYNYIRAVRGGQSRLLSHLVILSPNQADTWDIGSQIIISWDTQGIAGNVAISISRDGGKTYTSIAGAAPNNGSYTWTVAGPASVNCMLKIEPLSDLTKGTVQGLFTISQQAQPGLSVSPASRDVAKDAGTTVFSVSNTETGTMSWTAQVTPSSSWLTITSGTSGSNAGTINCIFTANTRTSARTATIRITATGATGSPKDVTVTQAGNTLDLSIVGTWRWFTNKDVNILADHTMSDGTNTGTWAWQANRTYKLTWNGGQYIDTLTLSDNGLSLDGTNQNGTHVTATRIGTVSTCVATMVIDSFGKLSLKIPYLSYAIPMFGAQFLEVEFAYVFNPTSTLLLFELTKYQITSNPSFSCAVSTLTSGLTIHIPDVLLPDGITHMWMNLEYSPALSINGDANFVVTNFGAVSN